MPKKRKPSSGTQITIRGNVSGQVAVGENISQSGVDVRNSVSAAELAELGQLLKELRVKVESEVPASERSAALEQLNSLEQAVTEKKPDLSVMESVRDWFGKNLPALAGAVTSLVVHPIVGKLVEAGGDLLSKEFQRRFGGGG